MSYRILNQASRTIRRSESSVDFTETDDRAVAIDRINQMIPIHLIRPHGITYDLGRRLGATCTINQSHLFRSV